MGSLIVATTCIYDCVLLGRFRYYYQMSMLMLWAFVNASVSGASVCHFL